MTAAEFIRRAVNGSREVLEALTPIQRFACDLRSIDRFKKHYRGFARDAGRDDLATRVEDILTTLWRSGEAAVSDAAVRAIIPNEDTFPTERLSATAESLMIQLLSSLKARRAGTIETALEALDCSFETAYMHAQEAEADEKPGPPVYIYVRGSPQDAANVERWLTEVQAEIDARAKDMNDLKLRSVQTATFGPFRNP
jgi:hypothetical protein